jgi:hypothetical protein
MASDSEPSLNDVYSILRRADEHFARLASSVSEWLQSDGFELAVGQEDDGWYRLRFVRVPDPPADHAHYLKEMLGDLRSALDYLVWQLVLVSGGAPDISTAFPIVRRESDWVRSSRRRLKGMKPEYMSRIKELQPFNEAEPDQHPLAFLDEANNRTKHRFLARAAVNRFRLLVSILCQQPQPENASMVICGPRNPEIGRGAVILSVRPDPPDWKIMMEFGEPKAGTSFDLGIGGLTDFPDLPTAVRAVIYRFDDVFVS